MNTDNAYGLGYDDAFLCHPFNCPYEEGSSLAIAYGKGYDDAQEVKLDI